MLEAVESGLIAIWKRIYTARADMCQIVQPNASVRAAMKPLVLSDFAGVILTFGIGICTGLLLLLLEWMRKHRYFDTVVRALVPSRAAQTSDPVEMLKTEVAMAKKKLTVIRIK